MTWTPKPGERVRMKPTGQVGTVKATDGKRPKHFAVEGPGFSWIGADWSAWEPYNDPMLPLPPPPMVIRDFVVFDSSASAIDIEAYEAMLMQRNGIE